MVWRSGNEQKDDHILDHWDRSHSAGPIYWWLRFDLVFTGFDIGIPSRSISRSTKKLRIHQWKKPQHYWGFLMRADARRRGLLGYEAEKGSITPLSLCLRRLTKWKTSPNQFCRQLFLLPTVALCCLQDLRWQSLAVRSLWVHCVHKVVRIRFFVYLLSCKMW